MIFYIKKKISNFLRIKVSKITKFLYWSLEKLDENIYEQIIENYYLIVDIFNTNIIFLFIGIALVGSLFYLFWYKEIDLIGALRGISLNITYIVWTMIFSKLILNTDLNFQFIIASIIIFLGVVVLNKKEY